MNTFGLAIRGVVAGVKQDVAERQSIEDADAEREARALRQRALRNEVEFGERTADDRASSINSSARSGAAAANVAEGTVDSRIATSQNNARITGAAADVGEGTVDSRISTSQSQARSAAAGADVAEGTVNSRIRSSNAAAAGAESDVRVKQGTERSRVASTNKQNEAAIETSQEVIDRIGTDRLNGVQMNEGLARKYTSIAQRETAKIGSDLAKYRSESGFDQQAFMQEHGETVLNNAVTARYLSENGRGDMALDAVGMDIDGDGTNDLRQAGAVSMEVIQTEQGPMFAAINEAGGVTTNPITGAPNMTPVDALDEWETRSNKNARELQLLKNSAKSGTTVKANPQTISEATKTIELADKGIEKAFNTGESEDGLLSLENSMAPEDIEDLGGADVVSSVLEQMQSDAAIMMANLQKNGQSVADLLPALKDPVSTARALYPEIFTDKAVVQMQSLAKSKADELARIREQDGEGFLASARRFTVDKLFTEGNDDGSIERALRPDDPEATRDDYAKAINYWIVKAIQASNAGSQ